MGLGIKTRIKKLPFIDRYVYGRLLYKSYKDEHPELSQIAFIISNYHHLRIIPQKQGKCNQIAQLIQSVDICPTTNRCFFYSIDPYKQLTLKKRIFDNCPVDYTWVVNSSFLSSLELLRKNSEYDVGLQLIIGELKNYVKRLNNEELFSEPYKKNIEEIDSLFIRPADHFHEALQRILFVNQWVWQSAHKNMGLGHLDWILYELYKKDLDTDYITKEDAKNYIKEFFNVLHENYWFKSSRFLGDTGQIVILGGKDENDHYRCNDLTYLFIEVSKELKLPEPKVLLRVTKNMPNNLLELAVECISTGIGAPLLSNDDRVIPSLIQFGYGVSDACDYATSACWEPLSIGNSFEQNNIMSLNFGIPFLQLLNSDDFELCKSIEDIKTQYFALLNNYLDPLLSQLDILQFEEDPFLTLFNLQVLRSGIDITQGGAKYSNLGITSVGLSTVVNSLLNLDLLVFKERKYTLHDLNNMRKQNFDRYENVRLILDKGAQNFGNDDDAAVSLTNEIMLYTSGIIEKHSTRLGGHYKYGLSSPNYISDSNNLDATFDGRKAGQPFGVHISGKNGLPPTELIHFASMLNYNGNRINGNVVDFILSPGFLRNNLDKAVTLIKGGIQQGFYQLQINVVDSKTLIEAQKHPELFPDLVVRVWGFSAYFKDLPKEYQDNLIRRVLETEGAAAAVTAL